MRAQALAGPQAEGGGGLGGSRLGPWPEAAPAHQEG